MSNNEIEAALEQLAELLASPPSHHLSSDHFQQRSHVENEVIIDINKMIQDCGDDLLSSECCIYRVPYIIRHLKKEAYTPQFVSIGPFHHGNKSLQYMERSKQKFFKRFTQRAKSSWQGLVPFVNNLVPNVRASYSETINLTQQELVKLILMDAGFIIELFISCYNETFGPSNNDKLSQQWLDHSIREDLLLIENQLPFFIIEELFNKASLKNHDGTRLPPFLELAYHYFRYYNVQLLEPKPQVEVKHFTHLIRLFYLRDKMPKRDSFCNERSHILSYNANALQEAGIKLKPSEDKCFLNLKLSGHKTLEIPHVSVDACAALVFRNVIAFERCHCPHEAYITDYALLLDLLIDTSKDVDLLVKKKIVNHYLGDSHKVASLVNGLWVNVGQSKFNSEYRDICKGLNDFCGDSCMRRKATLRRDYCNTPWRTVASVAGSILLVLTIVQTIFSILQVVLI
ncbi:hypothetical protein QN277_001930 [Acacia crassicarpa]|uniref:Uncharacterized protein n=1 Tax=Acacia crassicarpa TaxID=499986 RepID=A0AAE1TIZ8_9FABA|nr:hypothetical protein QN277_001930 [Acacia crassicarpa]